MCNDISPMAVFIVNAVLHRNVHPPANGLVDFTLFWCFNPLTRGGKPYTVELWHAVFYVGLFLDPWMSNERRQWHHIHAYRAVRLFQIWLTAWDCSLCVWSRGVIRCRGVAQHDQAEWRDQRLPEPSRLHAKDVQSPALSGRF